MKTNISSWQGKGKIESLFYRFIHGSTSQRQSDCTRIDSGVARKGLEDVKEIVEKRLRNELDILEEVFKLNEEETKDFYVWYMNNKLRKGIEEICENVRRRADREVVGTLGVDAYE